MKSDPSIAVHSLTSTVQSNCCLPLAISSNRYPGPQKYGLRPGKAKANHILHLAHHHNTLRGETRIFPFSNRASRERKVRADLGLFPNSTVRQACRTPIPYRRRKQKLSIVRGECMKQSQRRNEIACVDLQCLPSVKL